MNISGVYFNGVESQKFTAHIEVQHGNVILTYADKKIPYSKNQVLVNPPLGQAARILDFSDGSRFETFEFQKMDVLFPSDSVSSFMNRVVHKLEKNMSIALGACFFLVLLIAAAYVYGIPMSAKYLAHKAPYKILVLAEKGTLDTLKRIWQVQLAPLDSQRYPEAEVVFQKIRAQFSEMHIQIDTTSQGFLGANAFALPAGQVVVTEGLLNIVTPNELYAILLHEVGHISHRHGTQAVIKNAGLFLIFSLVLGVADFSSIPLTLISASYSRDAEREADTYSAQILLSEGLSPLLLSDGLHKIEKKSARSSEDKNKTIEGILSTHPLTKEREKNLQKLSETGIRTDVISE